jgi:hypothetical protein
VKQDPDGTLTVVSPFKYFDPNVDAGVNGQDAFFQIVYKPMGRDFVEVSRVLNVLTTDDRGEAAVTPTLAAPNSKVVTQLPVLDLTNHNVTYAMTTNATKFDATQKIDLTLKQLNILSGQDLYLEIQVADKGNEGDSVTATAKAP